MIPENSNLNIDKTRQIAPSDCELLGRHMNTKHCLNQIKSNQIKREDEENENNLHRLMYSELGGQQMLGGIKLGKMC